MRIEWLTTATNPRRQATGYDAGRTGWKLHAVRLDDKVDRFQDIPKGTETLCGIWPNWGFDLDLFIEDRCKRCERILSKNK